MSRHPDVLELVSKLVGTWVGHGEGGYPTIEPFRYRELLAITERSDHPSLHYDQRAWREVPQGEVVSHWETGLLRISSDGTLKVFNAQAGRGEAMRGTWSREGDSWLMQLESLQYAGDDRVLGSIRTLTVEGDTLSYEMAMSTTTTSRMEPHLRAVLSRTG